MVEVDFRWDGFAEPFLIEVNPRFWAGLFHTVESGVDFPWMLYELAVTGHTVADEVSQQGDNGTGAFLILLQLRDALNHGVGAVPHEAVHEGMNAGLLPQVALPEGQLLLRKGREIGHCHFGVLVDER